MFLVANDFFFVLRFCVRVVVLSDHRVVTVTRNGIKGENKEIKKKNLTLVSHEVSLKTLGALKTTSIAFSFGRLVGVAPEWFSSLEWPTRRRPMSVCVWLAIAPAASEITSWAAGGKVGGGVLIKFTRTTPVNFSAAGLFCLFIRFINRISC